MTILEAVLRRENELLQSHLNDVRFLVKQIKRLQKENRELREQLEKKLPNPPPQD